MPDASEEAREEIAATDEAAAAAEKERADKALGLFDIRRIIGGLLGFYGVVLLIYGIVGSEAEKTKASGININLWVGGSLIVVALIFFAWTRWRPLVSDEEAESGRGTGHLRRAHS